MQRRIEQILRKGKAENAGVKEKQEMFSLFYQDDKEFELKNILLNELESIADEENSSLNVRNVFRKLWNKIEAAEKHTKSRVRILNTLIKVAAAVVIGLFAGYYLNGLVEKAEPVYYTAYSPRGSMSEVVMPDGSVIFLNSGSRIKYSINGKNRKREVYLNGEAWFEVEKDKKKPFIVHTSFYDVNVTGTKFNVKSYDSDEDVATTLTEGSVFIKLNTKKLSKNIILKPGQQMVLNKKTKKISVKKVNTKWYTSWKDNKLIFVNMSLKDFAVILERKYGVDIEINEKSILDLHIDCTIKDETIIEILDIIQKTLPVKYKIIGQKIEITKK